jgi:hypothetical protein
MDAMTTPATPPPPAPVPPELPEGYHVIPKDWLRMNVLPLDALCHADWDRWDESAWRGRMVPEAAIRDTETFYATRAPLPAEPTKVCDTCKGTGYIYKDCLIHSLGVKPCPGCNIQQPAESGAGEPTADRTDQQIVDQTNALARELYRLRGYTVEEGYRFDKATHPHEREAWRGACIAQELLTETEVENALMELEELE